MERLLSESTEQASRATHIRITVFSIESKPAREQNVPLKSNCFEMYLLGGSRTVKGKR